jgi:hypothetical protein
VEIKPSSSSTWVPINVLGTSHLFEDLMPNTSYDWRVRTRCGSPVSIYSVVRTFTTLSGSRTSTASSIAAATELYPNPTQGTLTVATTVETETHTMLEVLDLTGRRVASRNVTLETGRNELQLDLTVEPAGVYFVRLLDETFKVVLTK